MGPEPSSSSLLPRPRFSWDIKNVPWTYGKGNKEEYSNSVPLWNAFHDKLPDSNSNKIPNVLRGIMLQSKLFGRARHLCKSISAETIQSVNGSKAIVDAIHKRDALSVVSVIYENLIDLLSKKRGANESFRNFESRFNAQVSKMNAASSSARLPQALTALKLLENTGVEDGQRVSALAAVSSNAGLPASASTDELTKTVSYEKIASVLRQCDQSEARSGNTMAGSSANAPLRHKKNNPKQKTTLTPEALASLKARCQCHLCSKYGH